MIETIHAYVFEPIRLDVVDDSGDGQNRPLVEQLRGSLEDLAGFNLVDERSEADWLLYILRPCMHDDEHLYESADHTLPRYFADAPHEVWVVSPQEILLHERMRIPLVDPEKGTKVLRENLAKLARIQEIKRLESHAGAIEFELKYFLARPDPGCQTNCVELPGADRRRVTYRKEGPLDAAELAACKPRRGDVLSFGLQNQDREDYYADLINVAPGGDVQPIFPRPQDRAEYARVNAGEFRDLSRKVGMLLDTPGEEYLKLIIARQAINVRVFQRTGYRFLKRDGESSNFLNPLERLLGEALHTRGQMVAMPGSEWDTRQASLEVLP